MAGPRDREPDIPPRYLAQLPWIGPVQGELSSDGRGLSIGAAVDPLLGEALAAVLLAVVREGERFVRVPGKGWVLPIRGDREGPFHVLARTEWWQDGIAGLLMVLLYDRSAVMDEPTDPQRRRGDRRFPDTWEDQLRELDAAVDPTGPASIDALPREMRGEIEKRVAPLLKEEAKALEVALIERTGEPLPLDITFAVASCQYPAGFLDRDIAEDSYRRLRARTEAKADGMPKPSCLLLLGDQVYIDATAGLFDPSTLYDRYDLPYERLFRTESLRHVLRRIPAYTMLDDHEIEDNWEPGSGSAEHLRNGLRWYCRYQRMAGPAAGSPAGLWYRFEVNGFPFFMADTRTERDGRRVDNLRDAHIMRRPQRDALRQWLETNHKKDVPMFIASPASFLPRHRRATHGEHCGGLRSDGWDGYPATFHALIGHIAENGIRNVVFLSGDEHISFATTAVIRDERGNEVTRILSIHSSGLYAPFAFANSTRDALAHDETFKSGRYTCHVSTDFAAAGDGFALLRAYQKDARWRLEYLFDRDPQPDVVAAWKLF